MVKNKTNYETCVICGFDNLEPISSNWNGAEWVCTSHSEEEWEDWCRTH